MKIQIIIGMIHLLENGIAFYETESVLYINYHNYGYLRAYCNFFLHHGYPFLTDHQFVSGHRIAFLKIFMAYFIYGYQTIASPVSCSNHYALLQKYTCSIKIYDIY